MRAGGKTGKRGGREYCGKDVTYEREKRISLGVGEWLERWVAG